jgi:hypothetical protein
VTLGYLETLIYAVQEGGKFDSLLQLITPGPGPLSLSLARDYYTVLVDFDHIFKNNQIGSFFARSNVPVLSASGLQGIAQVMDLLNANRNTHTFSLDNFWNYQGHDYQNLPQATKTLDTLFVQRSRISVADILSLVQAYHIRKVILSSCQDPAGNPYNLKNDIIPTLQKALSENSVAPNTSISYS